MKYRYSLAVGQENADGHGTRRPIVDVTLSRGNHRRRFLALLDSGADQIWMPAGIADVFGIDRGQCPERIAMGVSMEPITGFVGELTFQIDGQEDSFQAPVVFIDTEIPVLLGREAFFDRYRIKF